jgi:hypothetical protein
VQRNSGGSASRLNILLCVCVSRVLGIDFNLDLDYMPQILFINRASFSYFDFVISLNFSQTLQL